MREISFILPVLDEAETLGAQLGSLQPYREAGHEVVVVDGGSQDGTLDITEGLVDRAIVGRAGRASQMNRGAALSTGAILVFLHADTRLPDAADALIKAALAKAGARWGWFDVRLSHPGLVYRIVARCMGWRARLTRVCTGDQTLFVERGLFIEVGGFPDIPLMEDVAMSKRLRRHGRACRVARPAVTSSRRWEQYGVVRTVLFMWKLRLLYVLGIPPDRLAQQYYPQRGRNA